MRVLVADARELLVDGLRRSFAALGIDVTAACDGRQTLKDAASTRPDVVLLSSDLPPSGMDLKTLIQHLRWSSRVLVLAREDDLDLVMGVLHAGASGFLTDRCTTEELVGAILAVQDGDTVVAPSMLTAPVQGFLDRMRDDEVHPRLARLTERERQVLALLVTGTTTRAIADVLVISPLTARTHVQRILAKLEVHSQTEAAVFAVRNGIRPELEAG